ncbi:MAG: hypothetical protein ACRDXE_03250 [Acidimicrobiales bacterium]
MRTVDRVIRDGIARPPSLTAGDLNAHIIDTLRWSGLADQPNPEPHASGPAKIIVADDVAEWSQGQADKTLAEYGRLSPPWWRMWVEYPSYSGRDRRAAWIHGGERWESLRFAEQVVRGDGEEPADLLAGAFDDAAGNGTDLDQPGWLLTVMFYVEHHKKVAGPVGAFSLVLDADGFLAGNRWQMLMEVLDPGGDPADDAQGWMLRAFAPTLDVLELLHMRNVTVAEVRPEAVRRDRKRGNLPPVRYHVLRLHLPRKGSDAGTGTGTGISPGEHIVAGHVAHYGDCCPGQHAPHKRLFGRHEGTYWVPSHLRGRPEHGHVVADLEIAVDA